MDKRLNSLPICLKTAGRMADSADPDQTPRSAALDAASDLGLHCLLGPVPPNTHGK